MKPSGVREIEVAVFGGGPAGAAAAFVLAKRGYSTVVVEQSDYGNARIGETLPPAIEPLLVRLGNWDRFITENHSPSFGVRSAWGREELYDNDFIFNPYGNGWHVERNRFDAMLASSAEDAGASIYRRAEVASCVQDKDGNWQIEIWQGNRRLRFRAGFAVDATGRRAGFARKQGAQRIILDHLIGVAAIFTTRRSADSFTLIEAAEDGWWYSAALPDSRLIAVYMTDADMWAKARRESDGCWLRQLERSKHTRARVGRAALASKPRVVAANSSRLDRIADGNWLAAGEAAIKFISTPRVSYYRTSLPMLAHEPKGSHGGQWYALLSLSEKARDADRQLVAAVGRGALPYSLLIHAYSDLNFRPSLVQSSFEPGANVDLRVAIDQYGVPLTTASTVWAEIRRPDGTVDKIMFARTGPGRYSASVTASEIGVYTALVRARGVTFQGDHFQREERFTAVVFIGGNQNAPKPDDRLCELIECLLRGNLGDAGLERWKGVLECLEKRCQTSHGSLGGEKPYVPSASFITFLPAAVTALPALQVPSGPVRFAKLVEGKPVPMPPMEPMIENFGLDLAHGKKGPDHTKTRK